jgi:geranylgeranyl pyrophosphate synthase
MNAQDPRVYACFRDYAASVKPALDATFTSHLVRALGDTRPLHLDGAASVLTDGKKTRGALLCLVTSTLGGTLESALPRAAAVELIQTATLIHDDFVDQHRQRRNLPALWTLEGARRAVLLGDVLFASAIHMLSELGPKEGRIVSHAIAEISRGAYQEPLDPLALADEIEAQRVDGALYQRIVHLKTGVLFGAACHLGALAAQADDVHQQGWLRYGLRIGEAYQIADDLHEVRRHLRARSTSAGEIAALAPALLFFAQQIRAPLLQALRQGLSALDGDLLPHFEAAAESMEAEIERRSHAAVAEIEARLPDNVYGQLARETPRGLIEMFNEASAPASAP